MARAATKATTTKAPKKISNDTLIECKNGTRGGLFYRSPRTNMEWEWSEFGEIQEIEYGELVTMRGAHRRFFEDNWILIEDSEVLKQLGVERYYQNALTTENFDSIFSMSPEEIRNVVPSMSMGLRSAIHLRAVELVKNGELDSYGVINALNELFDCDIIEDSKL